MKKIYLLIPLTIVLIVGIIFIYMNNIRDEKFYLEDKYYGTGEFIDVNKEELESIIKDKENFLLYTYNNYCSLPIPCDSIFGSVMKEYGFNVLQIKFSDFKETNLYKKVKLAPSVLIFKDGKLVEFLDAESDNDLKKYQDKEEFKNWLNNYIVLKK